MASISSSSLSSSLESDDTSLTSSPRTAARIPLTSLAFAGAMTMTLKSPPSPPSTTTASPSDNDGGFSLSLTPTSPSPSPSRPISTTTSAYASCAYPSWPKSDILSPYPSSVASTSSTSSSAASPYCGSSYITDEDLLDLATLPLYNNIRIPPELLIARTPVAQPYDMVIPERRRPRSRRVILPDDIMQQEREQRARDDVVEQQEGKKRRRRSSPLMKRRKLVLGLSPVVESAE